MIEIVESRRQKATDIPRENEDKLHRLARYLYGHEAITGQEFMSILEQDGEK